jgi:hypothetical protein
VLIAYSFVASAQGRLENDTLYTSKAQKIYVGQVLVAGPYVGKWTAAHGFRDQFLYVKGIGFPMSKRNHVDTITVLKMGRVKESGLGNFYLECKAMVHWNDGSHDKANLSTDFEKALYPSFGSPEIRIP